MRGRPGRSRWRGIGLVLGGVSLLLCSSCVYLRLLELKHQLADFDHHFTLETASGLRLNFLHPLLLAEDIRWLGLRPATIQHLGQAEKWHLRWVKPPPPGPPETGTFEIAFDLTFTEGKLTQLAIGEKYFALLPKELLVGVLRSLGQGHVDQKERSVESRVAMGAGELSRLWPTRQSITSMLGRPGEEQLEGPRQVAHYHFVSAAPPTRRTAPETIDLELVYDSKTGELLDSHGRTPMGNLHFNFESHPTASPAAGGAH